MEKNLKIKPWEKNTANVLKIFKIVHIWMCDEAEFKHIKYTDILFDTWLNFFKKFLGREKKWADFLKKATEESI